MGENQTRGLAAQAALVALGRDDVVEDLAELADPDVLLGDGDEVELVGEQAADQRGADTEHVFWRRERLTRRQVEELVHLGAQGRDRRVGILGQPRPLVGKMLLLDKQDRGQDLVGREMARRKLECELVEGVMEVARELRLGPVRIDVPWRSGELESARDLLVERVEINHAAPLHVEQQPAARPLGEVRAPALQVFECLPPIRQESPSDWDRAACQAQAL